jgi:hypothetical protein
MTDDATDHGPRDGARIDLGEDHELRYWTQNFGCTGTELRNAMMAVGPMVDNVRAYLENQKA